jgi:hypothetical protein
VFLILLRACFVIVCTMSNLKAHYSLCFNSLLHSDSKQILLYCIVGQSLEERYVWEIYLTTKKIFTFYCSLLEGIMSVDVQMTKDGIALV